MFQQRELLLEPLTKKTHPNPPSAYSRCQGSITTSLPPPLEFSNQLHTTWACWTPASPVSTHPSLFNNSRADPCFHMEMYNQYGDTSKQNLLTGLCLCFSVCSGLFTTLSNFSEVILNIYQAYLSPWMKGTTSVIFCLLQCLLQTKQPFGCWLPGVSQDSHSHSCSISDCWHRAKLWWTRSLQPLKLVGYDGERRQPKNQGEEALQVPWQWNEVTNIYLFLGYIQLSVTLVT